MEADRGEVLARTAMDIGVPATAAAACASPVGRLGPLAFPCCCSAPPLPPLLPFLAAAFLPAGLLGLPAGLGDSLPPAAALRPPLAAPVAGLSGALVVASPCSADWVFTAAAGLRLQAFGESEWPGLQGGQGRESHGAPIRAPAAAAPPPATAAANPPTHHQRPCWPAYARAPSVKSPGRRLGRRFLLHCGSPWPRPEGAGSRPVGRPRARLRSLSRD